MSIMVTDQWKKVHTPKIGQSELTLSSPVATATFTQRPEIFPDSSSEKWGGSPYNYAQS
jgi:hypothetical protein